MAYLDDVDHRSFSWPTYLARYDSRLLKVPEGRRAITRHDPLAFGLIYLRHHLEMQDTHEVTMCPFHIDLCREALNWCKVHGPQEARSAWIAPRGSGKSSWGYLILPLWALAHGHRKFAAAYADSGTQAQQHLSSAKMEIETNDLLRRDFPDLCSPAVRARGTTIADRQDTYIAQSGAAFVAKGIDSSTLGAKIGNRRPDLILFDDVEPEESNYSEYQKDKRLETIVSAIFPMNLSAVVMFLGTTTMVGSIIHDLVRQVIDRDPPQWPKDENIKVRYYPPITELDDGTEESLWPKRWSLEYLKSIRHTRSYAKNMLNIPAGFEGGYWTKEDIVYGEVPAVTRRVLILDPAVTAKRTSDRTGIAIVSFSPSVGRVVVEHAEGVRLTGAGLRDHLAALIRRHPGKIHGLIVETNQGGDLWREVLEPLGLKVVAVHAGESKEVRFAWALEQYQKPVPLVVHSREFPILEGEMFGFPRAPHDDVADAVVTGVRWFLGSDGKKPVRATTSSYTR